MMKFVYLNQYAILSLATLFPVARSAELAIQVGGLPCKKSPLNILQAN